MRDKQPQHLKARRMQSEPSKLLAWFLAPTQLELAMLYVFLGICVVTATNAVMPLWAWGGAIGLLLLAIGVYLLLRGITFALVLLRGQLKPHRTQWLQLGLITATLCLIIFTNLDLALRVRLCERQLNREIQSLHRMSPEHQKEFRQQSSLPIGLFNVRVTRIDPETGTIWFETGTGIALSESVHSVYGGLVYCEADEPPEQPRATYTRLYGPWYLWLQDI